MIWIEVPNTYNSYALRDQDDPLPRPLSDFGMSTTLVSTRMIEMTPPDITQDLILRQGMHPRHCTVRITLSPFDLVILVLRAN